MSDLLPPIDPAVITQENMLNQRWPIKLTPRVQSLRRLIAELLSRADSKTGIAELDLDALNVPPALRIIAMRDLVTYSYFLPFAAAKSESKGRGRPTSYGRPGILAPLVGWISWDKAAPFSRVTVQVSLPIQRLLADIQQDVERGDLLNSLRIPGKYPLQLYKFLAAKDAAWEDQPSTGKPKQPTLTVSIPDLRMAVLGSKKGKTSMHNRTVDFLKFGIQASVKVINKFSDLRIKVESVIGVEKGHKVIAGVKFTLLDIVKVN